MDRRTVIIGQAPSRTSDPKSPLSGRSGERLADLCGTSLPLFLAAFERANLMDAYAGAGPKGDVFVAPAEARALADVLRQRYEGRCLILLGRNVASAFGYGDLGFFECWAPSCSVSELIYFAPHPSGTSHFWNEPSNISRARTFWRSRYFDSIKR